MDIELPSLVWKQSNAYRKEVIRILEKRFPGYKGTGEDYRWQYIAERAVRLLLEQSARLHEHNLETGGYPESMPFEVWNEQGRRQIIGTRIARKPHYNAFVMLGSMKDGKMNIPVKCDFYIACRCLTQTPEDGKPIPISIEGYLTKKELLDAPKIGESDEFKKPIRKTPYSNLHPIEDLIKRFIGVGKDPEEVSREYHESKRRKGSH